MYAQGRMKQKTGVSNTALAIKGSLKRKTKVKLGHGFMDTLKGIMGIAGPIVSAVAPSVQEYMKSGKVCLPVNELKALTAKKGAGRPIAIPSMDKSNKKTAGSDLAKRYLGAGVGSSKPGKKKSADDILNDLIGKVGSGLNVI